jgi:Rieske Fe-S protein
MVDPVRASRRTVVQAVAVTGVAGPLVAACSSGGGGGAADDGPAIVCGCHGSRYSIVDGSVISGPARKPLDPLDIEVSNGAVTVDGNLVGTANDVPVGGGAVFTVAKVVVTQPTAADYQAFTAVCTHQGCIVKEVQA